MNQINLLRYTLKQHLPWHCARLNFLALFLIALIHVRTINLSSLSIAFRRSAKPESSYKRLQRFFADFTSVRSVIVIGGGAAGFFAAISFAETKKYNQVTLLEAGNEPLSKVKISGGGRCNVTHHCFNPSDLVTYYPRGAKELRGAFSRFQPQDTVKWFAEHGVKLKTEPDGRMFPITDNSQTIIDCLINTAINNGVKLLTRTPVKSVTKQENQFFVTLKSGEIFKSDLLLIATGSNPSGYSFAQSLGHKIIPPVPSLFTFKIKDQRLENLAGISVKNVQLKLGNTGKIRLEQQGDLLITHWGISGPVTLKLSAWGARILNENKYKLPLIINWISNYNQETLTQKILDIKENNSKKHIFSYSQFNLPKRLWQNLVKFVGISEQKTWAELSKKELNKLTEELTKGRYYIEGKGVFKEEFVTCGGVSLKEINFSTMESKKCPGLYFAGEILDIDGVTGGFNFQSAWTTGWIAGNN
jgi:predicted Rossmann fold flavoprotein